MTLIIESEHLGREILELSRVLNLLTIALSRDRIVVRSERQEIEHSTCWGANDHAWVRLPLIYTDNTYTSVKEARRNGYPARGYEREHLRVAYP